MYIEKMYGQEQHEKINQFDQMVSKIDQDYDQFRSILRELYENEEKIIKLQGVNRAINEADVRKIILKMIPIIKVKKSDT